MFCAYIFQAVAIAFYGGLMLRIARILAPTDLSELSKEGVRTALEIGESQDAEVTVYHVIEHEEATRYDGMFHDEFSAYREVGPIIDLIGERKKLLAAFIRENFAELVADVKISRMSKSVRRIEKSLIGPARKDLT
jgi:nucleotide-binding universal stress UspA family protein